MRTMLLPLFFFSYLVGAQALASSSTMERVKSGILPTGAVYNIYQVTCKDQTSAELARTQRGRRWCTSYGGELQCFKRPEHAADVACLSADLAATANGADSSTSYQ